MGYWPLNIISAYVKRVILSGMTLLFMVLGDFLYIIYNINWIVCMNINSRAKKQKSKKHNKNLWEGLTEKCIYCFYQKQEERMTLSCTLISCSPPSSFFPDHHIVHIVTYQSSTKTSGLLSQPSHTLGCFLPLLEDTER